MKKTLKKEFLNNVMDTNCENQKSWQEILLSLIKKSEDKDPRKDTDGERNS
jgi:hypothetical protein